MDIDAIHKALANPVRRQILQWLKEPELKSWAESLIDPEMLHRQGILNADVVWRMWRDFIDKGEWRIQIWFILMFQQWMVTQQL